MPDIDNLSSDDNSGHIEKTCLYSTEQFDKSIIYIASGALGISFAFIKDIIPNLKEAKSKECLISSWYLFGCVIILGLICHFISMLGNNWAIKRLDLPKEKFNRKILGWNWPIRILNILMIIGILLGTYFLISFIKINH